MPGNGSRIRFPTASCLAVDVEGRVIEDRDHADMADFMAQIGLAPPLTPQPE